MFDGLQISFVDVDVFDLLQHTLPEQVEHIPQNPNAVWSSTCLLRHIFVKLFHAPSFRVKLNGSIHRFIYGDNYGRFSLRKVKNAVKEYSRTFHVDEDWPVIEKIEFGVNVKTSNPKAIVDAAMMYKRKPGKPMTDEGYYGKEWDYPNYYRIKIYEKRRDVLRVEIRIEDLSKFKDLGLRRLSDLYRNARFVRCYCFLINVLNRILFVPKINGRLASLEQFKKWGYFRSSSFWSDCSSDQKGYYALIVKKLIQEYRLNDFSSFLKKEVTAEVAQMIYVPVASLLTLFSPQGLHAETAADLKRSCGRPKDNGGPQKKTIPVCAHLSVANVRWLMDVLISTLSYHPLFPRGPPCRYPYFLFLIYAYNVARLIPVVARISLISKVLAL